MYIDWQAISAQRHIAQLARAVAQRWGIWVGFIDEHGAQVELCPQQGRPVRALCEMFLVNPSLQEGSCGGSLRRWAKEAQLTSSYALTKKTCHAGFHAVLSPVMRSASQRVGYVYASGFLTQSGELHQTIELKQRTRHLTQQGVSTSTIEGLPLLSSQDVESLGTLMQTLASLFASSIPESDVLKGGADATLFEDMIGESPIMLNLFRLIERVARSEANALVLGANGTGKELVARAIHKRSARHANPLMIQNCAAFPPQLMESELFGHKKGAYSGAHRDRQGLFAQAHRGTFFLDEIGELDLALQAKLLRVLQEGTFTPVGDNVAQKVDVRMICATNRDLQGMVRDGTFRQDLYYRVNVITLRTPDLRNRSADIPLLCDHFLTKARSRHEIARKTLSPEVLSALVAYEWPGNVRQLDNEIERMAILSGEDTVIGPEHLSEQLGRVPERDFVLDVLDDMTLPEAQEMIERRMILAALESTNWNKSQSAKRLGVSRRNLIRKVAHYAFEPSK